MTPFQEDLSENVPFFKSRKKLKTFQNTPIFKKRKNNVQMFTYL